MDGISQLSNHSILTDMDLFEKETSQNLYTCTPRYQEFKPLHSLNDRGPFHFEFWSPKDMYLLNTLRFTLTVRIVEDDGTVEGKAFELISNIFICYDISIFEIDVTYTHGNN